MKIMGIELQTETRGLVSGDEMEPDDQMQFQENYEKAFILGNVRRISVGYGVRATRRLAT